MRLVAFLSLCVCVQGAHAATSHCTANEVAAFECPMAHSQKVVSLCVTPKPDGKLTGRYVFGPIGRPELVYPAGANEHGTFHLTYLHYMGATGGTAYSFSTRGNKYILYAVSGTGFDNAGIRVGRDGAPLTQSAVADLACKAGTAAKANALPQALSGRAEAWGNDPVLAEHGMPQVK